MSCPEFAESISALADGTLPAAERPRLEIHLEACRDCRELFDDLRALRSEARVLEQAPPPEGLWPRVAARLREQGVKAGGERAAPAGFSWRWMGVAATLLAAVAMTLLVARMYMPAGQPSETAAPATTTAAGDTSHEGATADGGNAAAGATVEGIEAELRMAEEHYEKAIAGLEQVASQNQESLDPQVAETVKRNLQVIDVAIAESRSALKAEPQSQPARHSLFEALRRKIVLLQDTIALVNEMRKGNQAGAGEIAEGLNKS
jgi:anti-sigma factor RsiW